MKQKKIFNWKQYWEVVKQLKIVGIVASVIFVLIALIKPISSLISLKSEIENGYYSTRLSLPQIVDFVGENRYLFIAFMIVSPILTLVCWNFLTKRSSSDFYHSLPYTRLCTYLDHMLAVLTWELFMLLCGAITSTICYAAMRNYYVVDYGVLWKMYLSIFLCSMLCSVAISIACMITGTLFSNICVSGLVIFLPRFLMYILTYVMASSVPFLIQDHFAPWLNNGYNMLTSICFSILAYRIGINDYLLSGHAMLYTGLLAIIYFILAGYLYVHRKSETAGKGASSGKMQFVIRVFIGFTICTFGMATVIENICGSSFERGNMIMTLIITAMIAALIVSVYECINMKSIRGIVKSVGSILTSYVVAAIVTFAMIGLLKYMVSYSPDPGKITGVTFAGDDADSRRVKDYFDACASETVLEQKDIIKILCDAYNENVKTYQNNKMNYNRYLGQTNSYTYQVNFKDGWKSSYRYVYLTKEQLDQIAKLLVESESFKKAYLEFPEVKNASITWNSDCNYNVSSEDSVKLYEKLVSEAKSISFTDWYKNLQDQKTDLSAEVEFTKGGKMYRMRIPLTKYMPETRELYYQLMMEEAKSKKSVSECVEVMENFITGTKFPASENVYLLFVDPSSDTSNQMSLAKYINKATENGKATVKAICTQLADGKQNNLDLSKPYVVITYYSYGDKNYDKFDELNSELGEYEDFSYPVQISGYQKMADYYR